MKKLLIVAILIVGMAAPAQARWVSRDTAHPSWVSDWSLDCSVKRGNVAAVTFEVWDDSRKNRYLLRPRQVRPPTWTVTATSEELEEMHLRIRTDRILLGLGRTCEVVSNETGEELNFNEAWIVFGDIQRRREAARRNAIRERLGIPQEEPVTRSE